MTEPASPLSPPTPRETLHFRDYEFAGHRRADGLFDIEGRMIDRKTYSFPNEWRGEVAPGQPVHEMWIRLVLDEDFVVHDVEAATTASPFAICPAITPAFVALKGERIKSGWSALLKQKFGGTRGCTHHVEMLRALGTVAFQTIHGWKERRRREHGSDQHEASATQSKPVRRPGFIDTCHALSASGDVVRQFFPQYYEDGGASSDRANA